MYANDYLISPVCDWLKSDRLSSLWPLFAILRWVLEGMAQRLVIISTVHYFYKDGQELEHSNYYLNLNGFNITRKGKIRVIWVRKNYLNRSWDSFSSFFIKNKIISWQYYNDKLTTINNKYTKWAKNMLASFKYFGLVSVALDIQVPR